MIKYASALVAIGLLAMSGIACGFGIPGQAVRGSGRVVTEERDVMDFVRVSVSGGIDLVLAQGDIESLRIEAEDNLMPYIRSRVENGELSIDLNPESPGTSIRSTRPIRAYVSMIDVQGASVSGGGGIRTDRVASSDLVLRISGGGSIDIADLAGDRLTIDVSGGGNASIAGQASTQDVSISGGGNYDAENLSTGTAAVSVSGGGNATVWATERLTVNLSGGGNVYYYGSPQVSKSVSGGGEVIARGEH